MPRSKFRFTGRHNQWLIDHAGGIPGNVDSWAYTPELDSLLNEFNREFCSDCRHCEVLDWLIRGLQKTRYRKKENEPKLTKFGRRRKRRRVPVVSPEEHTALIEAYVREGIPLDRLAYTRAFRRICSVVPRLSEPRIWHYLQSRRRVAGGLPDICGRGRNKDADVPEKNGSEGGWDWLWDVSL